MKYKSNYTWWQAVLACIAFLAIFLMVAILSDSATQWIQDRSIRFVFRELILRLPVTLFLMYLFAKKVLKRDAATFNIRRSNSKPYQWFIAGVIISILFLAFTLLFNDVNYEYKGKQLSNDLIIYFVVSTIAMSINGGFIEEILFRGYIMSIIEEKWNIRAAVVVPSMIFGLLHLGMMETFHIVDFILLFLAGTMVGVMFSLMVIKTKSVYTAAIVHLVWNMFFAGKILKIKVLPIVEINSVFAVHLNNGNSLLNGGSFGVEASLIAILVYTTVSLWLLKSIKRQSLTNK
ncbi:MAG: CPBP family intramembrane metalloprotease [Bacteroidetes bacterium]|nr:CPBP family intramembrane metalloprotease [Bacteroidota bacterium]